MTFACAVGAALNVFSALAIAHDPTIAALNWAVAVLCGLVGITIAIRDAQR